MVVAHYDLLNGRLGGANREIVSFRVVRARALVVRWECISKLMLHTFPFPFRLGRLSLFPWSQSSLFPWDHKAWGLLGPGPGLGGPGPGLGQAQPDFCKVLTACPETPGGPPDCADWSVPSNQCDRSQRGLTISHLDSIHTKYYKSTLNLTENYALGPPAQRPQSPIQPWLALSVCVFVAATPDLRNADAK